MQTISIELHHTPATPEHTNFTLFASRQDLCTTVHS